jgi:transcriptional regulator with XRE-family HTH domain
MTTNAVEQGIPELTLGWRLRMALETSGISREAIAKEFGVDPKTISRWTHEVGAPPKRVVILQWAILTGVSAEWLEHGHNPPPTGGPGGLSYTPRDSNPEPADSVFRIRRPRPISERAAA